MKFIASAVLRNKTPSVSPRRICWSLLISPRGLALRVIAVTVSEVLQVRNLSGTSLSPPINILDTRSSLRSKSHIFVGMLHRLKFFR